MKTLHILSTLSALILATGCSPAEENGKIMSISTSVTPIDGTILMRDDTSTWPQGSQDQMEVSHKCKIVYVRQKANSGSDHEVDFVEVVSLPWLKGESYKVAIVGEELRITTSKKDRMIASINLQNIAPTLLTETAESGPRE